MLAGNGGGSTGVSALLVRRGNGVWVPPRCSVEGNYGSSINFDDSEKYCCS